MTENRTNRCLGAAVALLALVLAAAVPRAQAQETRSARYDKATALFKEAGEVSLKDPDEGRKLFAAAAAQMRKIARDGGLRNGRLYYNMANAYALSEDMGRAILYYRRAERYMPGDANLVHNLQYARRQRIDQVGDTSEERALGTLLFWHYDLAWKTRFALFAIAYVGLWALGVWRAIAPRAEAKWGMAACALVSVLLLASLVWDEARALTQRDGVVTASEVVARLGDGLSYEPAFTAPLHSGTEFKLVETRDEWLRVSLSDGRGCWLPAADIEMVNADIRLSPGGDQTIQ